VTTKAQLVATVALVGLLTSGCGSETKHEGDKDKDKDKDSFGRAADTKTCVADAKPYSGTPPANFAKGFPLPKGAVLFDVEDRGADGAIGTAVVEADLKQVLAVFNGTAQDQGFKITEGETEEHDAEANWTGNGYRGRWSIRDSATCKGQVVIQLLSKKQ
jgi:uncharacterized lipoprotein